MTGCLSYEKQSETSAASRACNRHERQAMAYLLSTALPLPAAYILMSWLRLTGAGISLLMVDLCVIGCVLSRSPALLNDNLAEFSLALLRAPGWVQAIP